MVTRGQRTAVAWLFVASALFLSGCHLISGGGWIASLVDPTQKATFGFTGRCRFEDLGDGPAYWFHEGQFEYTDKAAGVRFHADINPSIGVLPDPDNPGVDSCRAAAQVLIDLFGGDTTTGQLSGTYRQQPGGGTGDIEIDVQDLGEPGSLNGDNLCVSLSGGPLGGYSNCGTIQGGNLQVL